MELEFRYKTKQIKTTLNTRKTKKKKKKESLQSGKINWKETGQPKCH